MNENLVTTTLAHEVKENVLGYLKTTYNIKNSTFDESFASFLNSEAGIFRGPYLDIKLPFKTAEESDSISLDLNLSFSPYYHQVKAFNRLSSKDRTPESTLVVTGTGSGKSECFFIPIVDHCLRENKHKRKGIKAIILYPMNALATDQAGRIAEFLFEHPQVCSSGNAPQVSAGLLIGEDIDGDGKRTTYKVMAKSQVGETNQYHVIDDRKALVENPPDILLTNYKMLDYLLMKPEFDELWQSSVGESILKYLVLDEMHTFDGAQGSDVALLIRRLKAKLKLKSLTCAGTSATLLTGIKGKDTLLNFATKLFGEQFSEDSIIPESRMRIDEVFGPQKLSNSFIPEDADELNYHNYETLNQYIEKQIEMWFGSAISDEVELGNKIQEHRLTYKILETLNNKPMLEDNLLAELEKRDTKLSKKQLGSFLSIISHAKKEVHLENKTISVPLYFTRVQLWVRELRRPVASLHTDNPEFMWLDDRVSSDPRIFLPPIFCEECGEFGYLTSLKDNDFEWNVSNIYKQFVDGGDKTRYLFPWRDSDADLLLEEEQIEADSILRNKIKICPDCGNYEYDGDTERQHDKCQICSADWVVFRAYHSIAEESKRDKRQCPSCETRNSLRLVASRITTLSSVINGQLFLSPLNPRDSKKLLVFSDSVQDASHRAGYYNARTYRFNLRTAIQSFLKTQTDEVKVADLAKPFLDYWIKKEGEKKVVATFTPSDLQKMKDYDDYFAGKKNDMLFYLEKRVEWEFFLEYSLRSQVGRTLEKTLCSAIFIDDESLGQKISDIKSKLENEFEIVRQTPEEKFTGFVLGLLKRQLVRGGISLEIMDEYRENESSFFLGKHRSNQKWISGLPKGKLKKSSDTGALPKFITTNTDSKVFDCVRPPRNGDNWYSLWLKKNLPWKDVVFPRTEYFKLYERLMKSLVSAGIFDEISVEKKGELNFGLSYENIAATRSVVRLQCDKCAHKIVVADKESDMWTNVSCIVARCVGTYGTKLEVTREQNYYRRIYESGDVERIFAHEHTGLLKRQEREEVESSFKRSQNRREDSINLLSCTPTLEMGIDVGDLSATVVGSLPRTAANYQQQVGRAGRKSGSSLIVAIAQARPRDLLYFQYPEELIAGNVLPPGCFLDAADLIKRQFLAFLFDNYLDQIKGEFELKVKTLREELLTKKGGIVGNFKKLLEKEGKGALEIYKNQLKEEVSEETWGAVTDHFLKTEADGSFISKLNSIVEEFERSAKELSPQLAKINNEISEIQKKAEKVKLNDEERERFWEIKREKAGVLAQEELIGAKDSFFEFLTRYGFLPNYAFQEDIVELTGIILDEKEDDDGGIEIKEKESFIRPAKMALREFAPGSTFYGGGYKMQVEQLDIGGPNNRLIQDWRACKSCGYLQRNIDSSKQTSSCPKCGDPMWCDTGSIVKMLKLSKAIAIENVFSGHIGDESDDREKKFFQCRSYFEIDKSSIKKAWKYSASDFAFGIEFISKMTLREINFGEDLPSTKKTEIGGEELPPGFLVCPECGRVGLQKGGKFKIHHSTTCKHRKISTHGSNSDEDKADNLLLFRELQSEAIRLLLPVSDFESETRVASIRAALLLGFREKFGGQPLHLEISEQRIKDPFGNKLSKRFLVIFDSVPGGTGFLHELWEKESFYDLVKKAYDKLCSCSCNSTENLNGCLKCILGGVSQFDIPHVERDEARRYLEKILEKKDQMEVLEGSLDEVSIAGFLDSDLEYRFVQILEDCANGNYKTQIAGEGIEFLDFKYSDRTKFKATFKIKYLDRTVSYKMSTQRPMNLKEKSTVVDVLFEPEEAGLKPVALFLDGFEYHASKKSGNRFQSDFVKRQALFNGDGVDPLLVWNLTWRDLDSFEKVSGERQVGYIGQSHHQGISLWGENHLTLLLKKLACAQFENSHFKRAFSSNDTGFSSEGLIDRINSCPVEVGLIEGLKRVLNEPGEKQYVSMSKSNSFQLMSILGEKDTKKRTTLLAMTSIYERRDEDQFLNEWEAFLHTWNVTQIFSDKMICKIWAENKV